MEMMEMMVFGLLSAAASHRGHFVAAVDGVHAADVVGAGDVVDAQAAALGAGDDGRGPAAAPVTLRQAQREQAEVGRVLQADQARAGLGRHLLVRRRLLVAVHAAAQQLLVLRRSVVLAAHKRRRFLNPALLEFQKHPGNGRRPRTLGLAPISLDVSQQL